jgi:O-antigen biosynthesis protein
MRRRIRDFLALQGLAVVTVAEAWCRERLWHRPVRRPRLLFVDMRLPLPWYGAGFSRANAILRLLLEDGWQVTCYSIMRDQPPLEVVRADIPSSVRIVEGGKKPWRLMLFLLGRVFTYDLILISRHPTFERVGKVFKWLQGKNTGCKIVFDFEALPPMGVLSRRALGNALTRADAENLVRSQIADVSWVDAVICNSMGDAKELQRLGRRDATPVNYLNVTPPTAADFSERKHMLFVGRLVEENSPNVGGLAWFIRHVWPIIVARLGQDIRLLVVGLITSPTILKLKSDSIEFVGVVGDLHDLYNGAKLLVAANRVTFGVPIKVLEAAAYGLPVVTTNEVNSYLEWRNGTEILCDDEAVGFAEACIGLYEDPLLWRKIRNQALAKVDAHGSRRRLMDLVHRLVPRIG